MRREIAAGLLLLSLLGGSIGSLRYYDSLTGQIKAELDSSREAVAADDLPGAREHCLSAQMLWLGAKPYTHIFIRHQEVDNTSDAFFELLQLLDEGNTEASNAAFDKLLYHLNSTDSMEHPSLGSVF